MVLDYVKQKLNPSRIVVHGRSLGTHVAKYLSPEVDVVVTDRGFSSISKPLTYSRLYSKVQIWRPDSKNL